MSLVDMFYFGVCCGVVIAVVGIGLLEALTRGE